MKKALPLVYDFVASFGGAARTSMAWSDPVEQAVNLEERHYDKVVLIKTNKGSWNCKPARDLSHCSRSILFLNCLNSGIPRLVILSLGSGPDSSTSAAQTGSENTHTPRTMGPSGGTGSPRRRRRKTPGRRHGRAKQAALSPCACYCESVRKCFEALALREQLAAGLN